MGQDLLFEYIIVLSLSQWEGMVGLLCFTSKEQGKDMRPTLRVASLPFQQSS